MKDIAVKAEKVFGTDGVRGRANSWPMTAEMALRLGIATATHFGARSHDARVVIGKDTRRSGYMLENALTAGLTAAGMNVFLLGPVPTPAVGYLTRSMRADLGVMISASHNPFHDNGIKFFGPDGFKLSDEAEADIARRALEEDYVLAEPERIGRAQRIDDGRGRYVEYAKTTFPPGTRLEGLKVVIDCANGAAWRTAPEILFELGAEVVPLGTAPDGLNINHGVGSTAPQAAADKVIETGADFGICLDGDADRVILIDERGRIADGDQIMGLLATRWAEAGRLRGGALVATVMSNLGLERYLEAHGIRLERTKVGDRHVVERMRQGGFNLGGEQSGHIVMLDHATTGDGIIASLQVLAAMVESGQPASRLMEVFEPVPQKLENVRYAPGKDPLVDASVQAAIRDAEARLGRTGRLLIRPSGTEPVIRVMAESEDPGLLEKVVADIVGEIEAAVL